MDSFLSIKRNLDDNNDNDNDDNKLIVKKSRTDGTDDEIKSTKLTIVTHNCNSLYNRLVNKSDQVDYKCYNDLIREHDVDIICFQEVRAPAAQISNNKIDRTKVSTSYGKDKKSKKENEVLGNFLKNDFDKFFSLADQRYGGSMVAIKKGIPVQWIAYNFKHAFELDNNESNESFDQSLIKDNHYEDGRVIIVHMATITLIATYSPNNGLKPDQFLKRERFDKEISKFTKYWRHPLIWVGDYNIAPETQGENYP